MSGLSPLVYIVDDDPAVRDSLVILMETVGLASRAYESAIDFLNGYDSTQHACLVADIRMPGMSGLDLQEALNEQNARLPLIFITGHGDVPMAVDAMKAGAIDFIQKPFRDQDLLDRIQQALDGDRQRLEESEQEKAIRGRMDTLTPREREVMDRVVVGQANKVIALDLGVSQRTVELHRARVMKKMRVRSLAQLVRAAEAVKQG
jgi:FixJ family two-component response regulator